MAAPAKSAQTGLGGGVTSGGKSMYSRELAPKGDGCENLKVYVPFAPLVVEDLVSETELKVAGVVIATDRVEDSVSTG